MAPKVTLADVSRAAGVGVATVSRAMGDHPDVSEATRERVRAIAAQLGYRPSVTARALRTGDFHAISAIVPNAGWGWWEPVIRAAHAAANAQGYQLLVHPADSEGGLVATVDGLARIPTEGVIVISVPDQAAVREACDRIPLPAVAIDDTSRSTRFPTVSAANRDGARTVVEHLLATGRRSIAMVRGRLPAVDSVWGDGLFLDERLQGYRDALRDAGIAVDERLIVDVDDPFDETHETFVEVDDLLRSGIPIDAIFCAADAIAAPVLRSLRLFGRSVPSDVAVAGFDDERAAVLVDPQLTTARQPYEELGRVAVEMLLQTVAGEPVPESRTELATELILRDSTR